jgi:hypothetical protein
MMLALGLSYITFIMLKNVPSIPSFFRVFIVKGCWTFVKGFFCVYGEGHVVFVLAPAYMLYYIYGFTNVEPSLYPWKETNLVMEYNLIDALLNSVCQYFLQNLCIYIYERY